MPKVDLFYTVHNNEDGSASVKFHADEAAQMACDIELEEGGAPFNDNLQTVQLEFDVNGKLLNPTETKEELRQRRADQAGMPWASAAVQEMYANIAKRAAESKVKLFYVIHDGADGSASVSFHEDEEAALMASDIDLIEGGAFIDNLQSVELKFDSAGKLNPTETKEELRERLAEIRGDAGTSSLSDAYRQALEDDRAAQDAKDKEWAEQMMQVIKAQIREKKEEKYVPLEKSPLWSDMLHSTEKYVQIYPTRLHFFEHLAFVNGNGYAWSQGRLVDIYEPHPGKARSFDDEFEASQDCLGEDPADNPLFALIPDVLPGEFMKYLSNDMSLLMADRPKADQPVYPICQFASICEIPHKADVHYLSALMLMCKHVLLHPERLEKIERDKQLGFVRDALNTGFEIISQRGIENNFAKSCAELQEKIPFLTTFQKEYVFEQDRRWVQELEFMRKMSACPPAELTRVKEEIEALLDKLAPPRTGPSARRPRSP